MRISVYIPLAATALLAVLAPYLTRRLPPRRATWALAGAALVGAGSWLGALALLASSGFGRIPQVAHMGSWSIRFLRVEDPVARTVAAACTAVLLAAGITLSRASLRHGRVLLAAFRQCRAMPGEGELAVIDEPRVEAFALPGPPGRPGRVVVSTGMLRALDGAEREALLAHERAHLRGHHHFILLVLRLAAAACPLLFPLAKEGAFTVERWADEEAATAVGDRTVVARAVARAALATTGHHGRAGALAATGGPVPRRVRALLAPPPPSRRLPLLVIAVLLTLCCTSLLDATHDAATMFDGAQDAFSAAHYCRSAPDNRAPHPACAHWDQKRHTEAAAATHSLSP